VDELKQAPMHRFGMSPGQGDNVFPTQETKFIDEINNLAVAVCENKPVPNLWRWCGGFCIDQRWYIVGICCIR